MLKETHLNNGHIRVTPGKTRKTTGKTVEITITPAIS